MTIYLSGIVKHRNGYGFKITCHNPELANSYKDMLYWIIKNDKHQVKKIKGYYDNML